MRAVGIRNVDVAVVAVGTELKASIVGTMVLKELGVRSIVAKANDELHGKVLEKVGAERVLYPERDTGARLARVLTSTNIIEQIDLDPNYSIVEMVAPSHNDWQNVGYFEYQGPFWRVHNGNSLGWPHDDSPGS